jgi:hypothetical protein
MQTAYWQFWFSDRFTGARNPARLPTTIQSRRIRYAPTSKAPGGYYRFILARGVGCLSVLEVMEVEALVGRIGKRRASQKGYPGLPAQLAGCKPAAGYNPAPQTP